MKKTNNANVTVNTTNTIKEETVMKNTNVHAADYQTKDMIRKELESYGVTLTNNQFKNTKRDELLVMLEEKKAETTAPVTEETPANAVPVGDFSYDNAPVMDAPEVDVFNNHNISDVMFRIMNEAILNKNNTFISKYIILSCVRKVLFGKYSTKTDKYGRYTKEKNTFTPEQDATAQSFIDKLVAKYNYQKGENGYTIKDNYSLQPVYQWQDAKYQVNYKKKVIIKTSPAGTQEFTLTRDHIGLINQYGTLVGFTR